MVVENRRKCQSVHADFKWNNATFPNSHMVFTYFVFFKNEYLWHLLELTHNKYANSLIFVKDRGKNFSKGIINEVSELLLFAWHTQNLLSFQMFKE